MAEKFSSFDQMGKAMGHSKPKDEKRGAGQRGKQNFQENLKEPDFLKLDYDYVGHAEKVMRQMQNPNKYGKMSFGSLTTSKIRNILTLVNEIYNKVIISSEEKLDERIMNEIRYMKVRLVYESGREKAVAGFAQKSDIITAIDFIGDDRAKLIRYSRYLEALVAYFKFLGGDEQ
jgi:CRISPR type III-A-associated protein Csm2